MRAITFSILALCGVPDAGPGSSPVALDATPKLHKLIATQFASQNSQRTYIQTDKPLYQPGETIWFRADLRVAKTMMQPRPFGATMQLVSPRGAVVAQKRTLVQNGVLRNDFALDAAIEGGEYTIHLISDNGAQDDKKIIVNTYEAPRLMKTLELQRKAYGEGDQVTAAVEIKRTTGEPFAERTITAVVTIDDAETARVSLKTGKDGKATVKFALPDKIARGDGLLTVMAEDAGVTESIQKRIPIVLKTMQLAAFPEGGDLVAGVPGRVYFMAKTPLGKPADIEGRVIDDRGTEVATFMSVHDGMGRFELRPEAGRSYHLEITKPAGIVTKADVPVAKADGCVLRAVDQGARDTLRIAAICKKAQRVQIEATLRENWLAGGAFDVAAGKQALVELPVERTAQGAVRLTLFDAKDRPLAERLVYHGMGTSMKVTMTSDRKTYSPRDPVHLHVHATDPYGHPVKASVAVAVVDDTVLSYADDKAAKILAHTYLEPELGATATDPIEEPNFYFSDKPEAKAAMDALLATRGYRKLEWRKL
ncbi:MAG TPA: MG2 domain-containing protein [Kofleriaceae bacterium]|nr:MG2 domain-containing protein [Kofleriaceae bacterium]